MSCLRRELDLNRTRAYFAKVPFPELPSDALFNRDWRAIARLGESPVNLRVGFGSSDRKNPE